MADQILGIGIFLLFAISTITMCQDDTQTLQQRAKQLELENQKLCDENQKLRDESQKLRDESQKLRDENQKLRDDNQKLRDDAQRLRDENQKFRNDNQKLRDDNQKLVQENLEFKKLGQTDNKVVEDVPVPSNAFSLNPVFQEGQIQPQTVKAFIVWEEGTKGIFALTMTEKIVKVKENRPIKIIYTNVNGPQTFIQGGKQETYENVNGIITADVAENFVLSQAKDQGKLSDDILSYFPAGPFCGFVPPGKQVMLGETWNSGDIVPFGPMTFSKQKMAFSNTQGTFKLDSITGNIAKILWTGSADVTLRRGWKGSAKWTRVVLFNLKEQRTISNEGSLVVTNESGISTTYEVSIKATEK